MSDHTDKGLQLGAAIRQVTEALRPSDAAARARQAAYEYLARQYPEVYREFGDAVYQGLMGERAKSRVARG